MPLARAVRLAASKALYPVGWVVMLLWRHEAELPRRVPNLARFTRGASFRCLHDEVVIWLGRHFEIIEANAPWLDPAGHDTADWCATDLTSHPMSGPLDPPSIQCQRTMLRIYGADGDPADWLGELAGAIGTAGWGKLDGDITVPLGDLASQNPPTRPLRWRPVADFGLPDGLTMMPVARQFPSWRWVHLQLSWTSRGESTWPVIKLSAAPPDAPQRRTPVSEPLETAAGVAAEAIARALSAHQHCVAIRIDFIYYIHLNATRGPGKIATRLLPYRPSAGRVP